jgi:anti-sigma regulatory factor (Ser/Thr protein kinase)
VFPAAIPIEDGSAAAEVRRIAVDAALMEDLDEGQRGAVAIVASEIATNLHKHARGGEVLISRTSRHGAPGVEILSIDRGPGIADLARVFADGYSTSATAGTGLGAMRRIAHHFDIYSQSGKGTAVVARILREKGRNENGGLRAAAVLVPKKGENICGDSWSIRRDDRVFALMVADGLGHGEFAAAASGAAASAFEHSRSLDPGSALDDVHRALRGTRGAAVATAAIDWKSRRVRYAGLGNISGVILGGEKDQHMVSHNGTAGHEVRSMREFEYRMPERGMLIMHSDGITTNWNLGAYPGLIRQDPALAAAVLYRDANRQRDDVCVVAVSFGTA